VLSLPEGAVLSFTAVFEDDPSRLHVVDDPAPVLAVLVADVVLAPAAGAPEVVQPPALVDGATLVDGAAAPGTATVRGAKGAVVAAPFTGAPDGKATAIPAIPAIPLCRLPCTWDGENVEVPPSGWASGIPPAASVPESAAAMPRAESAGKGASDLSVRDKNLSA
jgi:hypothetical protein